MDVPPGLRQLGLTEYEARAYAGLLAYPGSTGYEAAKHSGVPRAKIYEVLDALVAKDFARTSEEEDRTRYHPLPYQTLLDRYLNQAQQVAGELGPQLEQLTAPQELEPLITLRTRDRVIAQAREIISRTQSHLVMTGWPEDMMELAKALLDAETRGVAVFAQVYGEAELPLRQVFFHHPVDLTNRHPGSPTSPWLVIVGDHQDALVAEMAPGEEAVALCTQHKGIAMMAAEYVKHDIFLSQLTAYAEKQGIQFPPELNDLQKMWFAGL